MLSLLNLRVILLRATSLQHKGRSKRSVAELTTLVVALVARKAAALRVGNAAEAALNVFRAQQAT